MSWQLFAAAAPDLAEVAQEQFGPGRVAVVGTIRADGSPRISNIEPRIVEGELYLGMMWQSRKALDLLHDPRLLLRNAVCTSTGDEVEIALRGRAVEVLDSDFRERYAAAFSEWQDGASSVRHPDRERRPHPVRPRTAIYQAGRSAESSPDRIDANRRHRAHLVPVARRQRSEPSSH